MVYVDDARHPYGRMIMCHMFADTRAELDAMAERIGIASKWIQHEGTYREHYDVCLEKRALAIRHGAQPITRRDVAALMRKRRV